MDWGAGSYERTAAQLQLAARACIDLAAPAAGERVIDVGCGTGNAALLAAELGARVTGVDPAERLLDVARGRAREQGLEIDFIGGEASSLPAPDAAADAVVSVFGAIFDPDAAAAARELARVTAPGGRIVLSAWIPGGALFDFVRIGREATAPATAAPATAPFAWHREDALSSLFSPLGFSVELHEEPLAFTAGSASEFVEAEFRDHPLWVSGRTALEQRGELHDIRDRALEIFEAANEEPDGFLLTSRYVMARMQRT